MGRRRGPAAREEGAFVGVAAVVADRHVGERAAQHRLLRADVPGDVGEGFINLGSEVLAHEQVGEVGVAAFAVEVHELGAADGQAGAAQDVRLDGEVGEESLTSMRCQPPRRRSRTSARTRTPSCSKAGS